MKAFKDVNEAAYKWPNQIKDEYLRRWIHEAELTYADESLSDSYKLGYVITTLNAIKAYIINHQTKET